ncbi:MAG: glycerate kinase type-2 family protein [Patescibacteria group bacterium]
MVEIKDIKYIKNFEDLATNKNKADALRILEAGYQAINTEKILSSKIKLKGEILDINNHQYNLHKYNNIYVIAIGKCSLKAAAELENILGHRITAGLALDITKGYLKIIKSLVGTHPLPSDTNIEATNQIIDILNQTTAEDLVLFIISGGGSALLCQPNNLSAQVLADITKQLTKRGADIYELNTVRKHLSKIKGGHLAEIAYPATVVSLIFSDVLGDDLSVIASGPTVKDKTTIKEAQAVLEKYDLWQKSGIGNPELLETPKDDIYFEKVNNILVISNQDAVSAMEKKAEELGYQPIPGSATIAGQAQTVGQKLISTPLAPGQVQINAGETTVIIKGQGKGGRNQEMALASLLNISPQTVFIAVASDGHDNTEVAGAIVDKNTQEQARLLNLDVKEYLQDNNSYNFFKQTGGQIVTGATGSNVSDLYILLAN